MFMEDPGIVDLGIDCADMGSADRTSCHLVNEISKLLIIYYLLAN